MSRERWGAAYERPALALVVLGFVGLAISRLLADELPNDLSAYVYAMRAFGDGESPYVGLNESPHFMGYPYVYFPGTLYLIMAASWVPAKALAVADALGKMVCVLFAGRWLQRRYALPIAWPVLCAGALVLDPLYTDVVVGNLATYMLTGLLVTVDLSEREDLSAPARLAAGFGLGLALVFKPMWGIGAAWVAALERRWSLVAGLALGAGAVFALGGIRPEMIGQWLDLLGQVRAYWPGFDLGSVVPWLSPVGAAAWAVMALVLWRRRPAEAWLWGCAFALAWPRLGNYSYLAAFPILACVVTRMGPPKPLLWCLPGTMLAAAVADAFDPTLVASLVVQYLWLLALVGWWLIVTKDEPAA